MLTKRLEIALAARTDLRDIYQYGLRQWGKAQSEIYIENIKDQLWLLTNHPLGGADRSELLSGTRSLVIKSHTVFYRVTTGTVEVIRVLHTRQDPQRHLK